MGRIYSGSNKKIKAYLGNKKVIRMWYGSIRVYPNAGEVTYYVDTNSVYKEEIDIDESCLNPKTFTPSKSGWTFVGWKENTTADSNVLSEKISDGNSYTLYAVFKQNITVTKYNGSSTASTETKTRYYNNDNQNNPSFTLSQNGVSGWSALGWCDVDSATASVVVNNGGSVTLTANKTYYGKYSQTITLSYNGNGANSGSTSNQTGTRYWNSRSYSNPSFVLRNNGFSRTNYAFQRWAMGSTGGTQYNAGASVTLSANTTFYAIWAISAMTVNSPTLSEVSNVGQPGNGDSWSTATVSGNKITMNFTNTSWKTHTVIVASGPWNLTGFTKCTATITASTANMGELSIVGIGSSRGQYDRGSVSFNSGSIGDHRNWTQNFSFNISATSSGYLYLKFNETVNYNYDRNFTSSMQIDKLVFS